MEKSFIVKGIYGNGMVLQRNTTNCIFGTGEVYEDITMTFRGMTTVNKVGENGNWKITFNPGEAGGPFELALTCGENSVVYKDVYVGEVWLNSGQSNAQLPMERMKFSYPEEFELPENPNLRMITIPIRWSLNEEKDSVENPQWLPANPQNLGGMSGTSYFFAKKLQEELGIPVGIINSAQGGSPIASWLDKKSLTELEHTQMFITQLEKYENPANIESDKKKEAENAAAWQEELNSSDLGQIEGWEKLPFEKAGKDWIDCVIPGYIDNGETAGYFWFKKEIELTAKQVKHFNEKKTWLWFGTIIDADTIWVNGVKVGETAYCYPPRRYVVPAGVLVEGKNTITVRVQKNNHFGKVTFYTEKPYYLFTEDVKICPTAIRNQEGFKDVVPADGEKIDLSGTWKMTTGCTVDDAPGQIFLEWIPTALYNGMLAPCFNYAIAGALWYQGESDAWHPDEYRGMLQKLIMLWREKFTYAKRDFPFVIMQLPNWSDGKGESYFSNDIGWAQMRQEQLLVTEIMENTGIAITIDAGEWNDLHPEKKRTGGTRAALEALRIGYGKSVNVAPKAIFTQRKGDNFIVQFETGSATLKTLSGNEISGFYFLYENENHMKMIEAKGVIISANEVQIPVPEVDGKFCEIRYLWADSPNPINLYSSEGLPAQAFRAVIPE